MAAKIVVVGSFNADLTSYMERMPRPGETVSGRKFVTGPGGKGSNQAVAAARLGADVTFVGRVGQDVFAEMALKMWQQEGIHTQYVVRDPDHATGVAPIFVDDTGENSIVVVLGANQAVSRADIDAARPAIAAADVLIVQLEIALDTVAYALQTAKALGIRSILNPAPAAHLPAETIVLADYITPNQTELEVLSGQTGDPVAAARALMTASHQTVVVTMGSQGALIVTHHDSQLMSAYPVKVVDTTGAGDAFNAGLAVALAEGQDLQQAVAFANATAALCVTRPGTAPSMPQRSEVEALLAASA